MIKRLTSRYHPRYLRSLVYMLQASEYKLRDYFAWLSRVDDFATVEKRKKLVKTPKTLFLLAGLWAITIIFVIWVVAQIFVIGSFNFTHEYTFWVTLILEIVLFPHLLAYLVAVPLWLGQILIQAPRTFFILRKTRRQLAAHPAVKIAVAGSYGKTTMREILATVLAAGKKVAAPPHSYNTPLGIAKFTSGLKGDEEVLVFELGEYYPGDVKKLAQLVRPGIGVITGINEAHLSKFKTLESTVATIFELADYLGSKPTYKNDESPLVAKSVSASDSLRYSRKGVNSWIVTEAKTNLEGVRFMARRKRQLVRARSELLGLHQIGPLVAAIDIADRLGLSSEQIEAGLSQTKPFEHRLQPKVENGVVTIDDSYNGNPDGVKAAIDFLALQKDYRRIYVTPGLVEMGARTAEVHCEIGRELANAVEVVVLIKNSVTPYIEEGLKAAKFNGELVWFDDALKAFSALPNLTAKGDLVLIQNDWPDNYA